MNDRTSTLDLVRAERPYEPLEHGAWKTGRVFADFVVDGTPLSTLVRPKADLISVLGWGSEQVQRDVRERLLLRAPADLPSNRRALYVCPECGDLSCGAVSAVIERLGEVVVWRDFGYENDYDDKPPDRQHLEALGDCRFAWDAYESAINRGYGLGGFDPAGAVRKPSGGSGPSGTCFGERLSNKRLKLTAHVDYGMNLSPVRCSLSAIR